MILKLTLPYVFPTYSNYDNDNLLYIIFTIALVKNVICSDMQCMDEVLEGKLLYQLPSISHGCGLHLLHEDSLTCTTTPKSQHNHSIENI